MKSLYLYIYIYIYYTLYMKTWSHNIRSYIIHYIIFIHSHHENIILYMYGRFPKFHRVFWAGTLAHWNPTSCQKKSTINLLGVETLKLKIRRLKLWKPTVGWLNITWITLILLNIIWHTSKLYIYIYIYIYAHVYTYIRISLSLYIYMPWTHYIICSQAVVCVPS